VSHWNGSLAASWVKLMLIGEVGWEGESRALGVGWGTGRV